MSNPVIHTDPDARVVVYLSTHHLFDVLPAAYNSLLAHTDVDQVYLLIDRETMPFPVPDKVTCVDISSQTFFPASGPNFLSQFTYMALMKSAMAKIFPDLHRVLILDADTIVLQDISTLWKLDLSNAFFAAVREPRMSNEKGYDYANVGVFMLNLDLIRETHMDDHIITELNARKHEFPEQDVFNTFCVNKWLQLPNTYNDTHFTGSMTGTPVTTTPHILHYAGTPHWSDFSYVTHYVHYPVQAPRYVAYIGNRAYYPLLVNAAKSLLFHSPVDKIFFLIEDDEFPEPLPDIIQCINVSNQTFFPPSCPNVINYYSYMTAMRSVLSKVLPDIDRVLLLDPDTIVFDDISCIWNYDISNHYFAAVQETRNHNHTMLPYYNAGVMLLNLAKIRADGMDDDFIHEMNFQRYEHLEQDVMNFLCFRHILDLPSCYNSSFVSQPCRFPKIMHFLSFAKRFLPEASQPYANKQWSDLFYVKGDPYNE